MAQTASSLRQICAPAIAPARNQPSHLLFKKRSLPILPRPQDKNHRDKRRRSLEKDQQNRNLQGASRFS